MSVARRLAELERRRLFAAVRDVRATLEDHDRALLQLRAHPAYRERLEERLDESRAGLTPEQRDEQERHTERVIDAIGLIRPPGATPADIARACALLEPLTTPRGSPPYAIVGALKRALAQWAVHVHEELAALPQPEPVPPVVEEVAPPAPAVVARPAVPVPVPLPEPEVVPLPPPTPIRAEPAPEPVREEQPALVAPPPRRFGTWRAPNLPRIGEDEDDSGSADERAARRWRAAGW